MNYKWSMPQTLNYWHSLAELSIFPVKMDYWTVLENPQCSSPPTIYYHHCNLIWLSLCILKCKYKRCMIFLALSLCMLQSIKDLASLKKWYNKDMQPLAPRIILVHIRTITDYRYTIHQSYKKYPLLDGVILRHVTYCLCHRIVPNVGCEDGHKAVICDRVVMEGNGLFWGASCRYF